MGFVNYKVTINNLKKKALLPAEPGSGGLLYIVSR